MPSDDPGLHRLEEEIEQTLDRSPDRPRCVHGLCEELLLPSAPASRDNLLEKTRLAAEELVERGRAQRAFVSAIAIGAHCEDAVYWSAHSPHHELKDFGPDFETLAIARRLASHFQCHGL